ncbi:hypothetical protein LSAT2_024501 [Lamellibrachia satsuma]|nr:hypothetical protein LSAT2_024501 [Lamellibrachia satsuma]
MNGPSSEGAKTTGPEKVMKWLPNNSAEILFSSSVDSCSTPSLIIITTDDEEEEEDSTSQSNAMSISSDDMEATTTEREERSPPTIYVLPDASILLYADGEAWIPDRPANPEQSTSQSDSSETDPEVCDIMIEEAVSNLIAYNWRRSGRTLDEAMANTCHDIKPGAHGRIGSVATAH